MNYGIVDLGSNTVRLSLYRVLPEGDYDLLFSKKEMAGLVNYISGGVLSQEGIHRACSILEKFRELLRHFGVENLYVFATAPLRNIRNSEEAVHTIRKKTGLDVVAVSAREETGIDQLENKIKEMFYEGDLKFNDEVMITNVRHKTALSGALESLKMVKQSIENQMPEDFLTIDLMDAYEKLGTIIGEAVEDDLVNEIFSRFCTGK